MHRHRHTRRVVAWTDLEGVVADVGEEAVAEVLRVHEEHAVPVPERLQEELPHHLQEGHLGTPLLGSMCQSRAGVQGSSPTRFMI